MTVKKLRVGIIYGGRSGEHEVSIASAASIFKHLDPAATSPCPIRIEKDGRWIARRRRPNARCPRPRCCKQNRSVRPRARSSRPAAIDRRVVDVVFPVLHGPYGEDGTVQGLLELANVPYVGAGVLGSAVGMDKAVMKKLFAADGLPIVPYVALLRREWDARPRRADRHGSSASSDIRCS